MAICVEEPLFQYPIRPPIAPEYADGWVKMLANEKAFETFYKEHCVKGGCSKRNIKPDFHKSSNVLNSDFLLGADSEDAILLENDRNNHTLGHGDRQRSLTKETSLSASASGKESSTLDKTLLDAGVYNLLKTSQGVIINNIRVSNGVGGVTVYRMGQAWIENSTFHNLAYGIRYSHIIRSI